jgi:hypothetical protein
MLRRAERVTLTLLLLALLFFAGEGHPAEKTKISPTL